MVHDVSIGNNFFSLSIVSFDKKFDVIYNIIVVRVKINNLFDNSGSMAFTIFLWVLKKCTPNEVINRYGVKGVVPSTSSFLLRIKMVLVGE
jgi:hypothetical protein